MRTYLLPKEGKFYKANLHCHTNVSDGHLSPEEVKREYMEKGYSIIAYTDHDIMIPHPELAEEGFLPMVGYEMEINRNDFPEQTCHLCFVGLRPDVRQVCWHREKYLFANAPQYRHLAKFDETLPDFEREYTPSCINEMIKRGAEEGFFVTYNHPTWSLESYENYMSYEGMHAMEIVNYSSMTVGFDDYNPRVYDDMLRAGKRIFCSAADDNHNHKPKDSPEYDSFGGFNMIKAEKLDYESIGDALVKGDFYASEGPEIYELYAERSELDEHSFKVYISCSDASKITLNTERRPAWVAFPQAGEPLKEATFTVGDKYKYFRLTVTDKAGKHACTRAYFLDELAK